MIEDSLRIVIVHASEVRLELRINVNQNAFMVIFQNISEKQHCFYNSHQIKH